jgi:hypothetical protein
MSAPVTARRKRRRAVVVSGSRSIAAQVVVLSERVGRPAALAQLVARVGDPVVLPDAPAVQGDQSALVGGGGAVALQARVIAIRKRASVNPGNSGALVPVLPRRERGNHGLEVIRQVEEPVMLVFLKRPAQPDCAAVLIKVTHLGRFQLLTRGRIRR